MAFKIDYSIIAVDKFSKVARKIRVNLKLLNRQLKRTEIDASALNKRMNKLTPNFLKFRNIIAGAALILGFKKLVNVGSLFQDNLAELQAITGAVGSELDFLSKSSVRLSKKFAESSQSILSAFTLIGSAKPELLKNIPALVQMTESVLKLKTAAGIDLSEAAFVATRSLNIFGKSSKSANKFVDVLAAGSKFGTSQIRETGQAAVLAAPQFEKLGLSFIDLNAAIQVAARGGFEGARAGTALGKIFENLEKQGVNFKKGLVAGLTQVKNVLDKIEDPVKKANAEFTIFGEHAKVGGPLLKNIALIKQLQKELSKQGIAQEQMNIRLDTFSVRVRRLGVDIQNKLIEAFFRLEPKLTQIIGRLGEFVDSIGPTEIDKFSNALKGVLSVFDSILTKLKDIKAILTVSGIGALIGGVIGGVTLGPAGIIPGAKLGALGGAALGIASAGSDFEGALQFAPNAQNSKSEVTVNINAPAGVVQSVQSKSDSGTNLNLGQNRGLNFGTP